MPTFCQQLQRVRVAAVKLQQVHAPGGERLGVQVVVIVTAREPGARFVPDITVDSQLQPPGVDLHLQTDRQTDRELGMGQQEAELARQANPNLSLAGRA